MNQKERILILAFYCLDKPERIKAFTKNLNDYFHKDYSIQTILYEVTKIKNIDPSNNMIPTELEEKYVELWKEYVGVDELAKLKEIYKAFKKNEKIENFFGKPQDTVNRVINDIPQKRPNIIEETKMIVVRNEEVSSNALEIAGYVCELNCGAELFISKYGQHTYTEGHHLIPLAYQIKYENSLDVEANIVSLCPACHRKLHYGINQEDNLINLYRQRESRLKRCGIEITTEELILMYQ